MTTKEVATEFYALAQQGNLEKIQNELFSNEAKSIEPDHSQGIKNAHGMDQIKEKGKQWQAMIEKTHSGFCNEPQVAGNYFTCTMGFDATFKGQGRMRQEEIALYEVKDGKIVLEQFFY